MILKEEKKSDWVATELTLFHRACGRRVTLARMVFVAMDGGLPVCDCGVVVPRELLSRDAAITL